MNVKKIRELIKIVEQSDIAELELTFFGGKKIRINKYSSSIQQPAKPEYTWEIGAQQRLSPAAVEQKEEPEEKAPITDNLVPIKSPIVGTFYRAPSPDAEPFVETGDHINEGQVVCIIEAMKLMNEIKSEVSGTIEKILVENGNPVEYGQELFLIKPNKGG